jgi:hypothetical protein
MQFYFLQFNKMCGAIKAVVDRIKSRADIHGRQSNCRTGNEDCLGRKDRLGGIMVAATPSERSESAALDARIDKMHGRDRLGAIAFVVFLWIVILFVLASIWPNITNMTLRAILVTAAALVLLFNTASIIAMLRHYVSDKHFIYGLDLKHLDEMRRQKRI